MIRSSGIVLSVREVMIFPPKNCVLPKNMLFINCQIFRHIAVYGSALNFVFIPHLCSILIMKFSEYETLQSIIALYTQTLDHILRYRFSFFALLLHSLVIIINVKQNIHVYTSDVNSLIKSRAPNNCVNSIKEKNRCFFNWLHFELNVWRQKNIYWLCLHWIIFSNCIIKELVLLSTNKEEFDLRNEVICGSSVCVCVFVCISFFFLLISWQFCFNGDF